MADEVLAVSTEVPPAQPAAEAAPVDLAPGTAAQKSVLGTVPVQDQPKRGRPPLTAEQRQKMVDQLRQARDQKKTKNGPGTGKQSQPKEKPLPVDDERSAADLAKCRQAGARAARSLGQMAGAASRYFGDHWRFTIFRNEDQSVLWDEPTESRSACEDLFIENNWSWWPGWLAAGIFILTYILTRLEYILKIFKGTKNAKADTKSTTQATFQGPPPAGHSEQPGSGPDAVRENLLGQIPGAD